MSTEDASRHWYVARDGKQTGPISEAEVRAIAAHGYFRPNDLVWRPGMAEWRPALSMFAPPPPAPPAPPPMMQPPAPPAHVQAAPHAQAQGHAQGQGQFTPSTQRPYGQPQSAGPVNQYATGNTGPSTGAAYGQPVSAAAMTGGRPAAAPPYAHRTQQTAPPASTGQAPAGHAPGVQRQLTPLSHAREPEPVSSSSPKPRTNRMAIVALAVTLIAIAGGVLVAAQPQLAKSGALEPVQRIFASLSGAFSATTLKVADIESNLQATAHWPIIKREFPDWYGERLREAAKLAAENKSPDDVARVLAERIVALRRQNASQALAASPTRLLAVANAFLANLRQLKQSSPQTCYSFISQGELTPAVLVKLKDVSTPPPGIQLQVAAIFEAIGEGRRSPVTYEKPQKGDYDALMGELAKLGWTNDDIATFANPRTLARTEPSRVCQMVQDWFVAHIAIADESTRQRLIGETLRPVVSG